MRRFLRIRYAVKKAMYGFKKKVFLVNAVIGAAVIVLLGTTANILLYRYSSRNAEERFASLAVQVGEALDDNLSEMEKTLNILAKDKNIYSLLELGDTSSYKNDSGVLDFYHFSRSVVGTHTNFDYYVCLSNGRIYSSDTSQNTLDCRRYNWSGFRLIDMKSIDVNAFTGFFPLIKPTASTEAQDRIACLKRLLPSGQPNDSFVAITLKKSYLDKLIRASGLPDFSGMAILDERQEIVFNSNPAILGSRELVSLHTCLRAEDAAALSQYRDIHVTVGQSPKTGWSVLVFASKKMLYREFQALIVMIFLIMAILLAIHLTLTYWLSARMTMYITRLTGYLRNAEENDYTIALPEIDTNDEITELYRSLGRMLTGLMEGKVLRRQAQIEILTGQLHPHFFYNTLETINTLALQGNTKAVSGITEKLGDIFRYSLGSDHGESVRLRDEIKQIEDYFSILKLRFPNRLLLHLDIDERLLDARMPKFILQPLVENSVRHGFKEMRRGCRIRILTSAENGSLLIAVEDNGCGATEEDFIAVCARYMQPEKRGNHRSGVGLANVHGRLRLLFGERGGLWIGRVNNLTRAEVRMPLCAGDENDDA